jgi:hypothetical protein
MGQVDIFDANGNFVSTFVAAGGKLNAPWGVVATPATFGEFPSAILVGNFGDGTIIIMISASAVGGFNSQISLACTAPTGLTCSLSPSTISPGSSAASSTLMLSAVSTLQLEATPPWQPC